MNMEKVVGGTLKMRNGIGLEDNRQNHLCMKQAET